MLRTFETKPPNTTTFAMILPIYVCGAVGEIRTCTLEHRAAFQELHWHVAEIFNHGTNNVPNFTCMCVCPALRNKVLLNGGKSF